MYTKSNQSHSVLILPGLSDRTSGIALVTKWWRRYGLQPYVLKVGWHDERTDIRKKLDTIILEIEKFATHGLISVVGTSAGGSMALNLLCERSDIVNNAVNICGRLRAGHHNWRALEKMSSTSKLFRDSVLMFEARESSISGNLRSRIMTISAMFGDELVPADTSYLHTGCNIKVPTAEHAFSIGMSLTFFAKPILDFIKFGKEKKFV